MQGMPKEGKWTIKMGEGDTIGIIKPLIPFNCLVDIDVGLVELIRNKYRSPDIFNIRLLDSFKSRQDLIKFMYNRDQYNPILPFMNNTEDQETANDLYLQFIEKEYINIVGLSPYTGLYSLVNLCNSAEEIAPMITFSDSIEEEVFNRDIVLKKVKSVFIDDIPLFCSKVDVFFFRSVVDPYFIAALPLLSSKNITILDYKFNFDADGSMIVSEESVVAEMNRCYFNVINVYRKEENNKEIG